ncbi:MAG: ribosome biogenesis GTPase YlqF [Clostridia bacterium]|nr:ribosome biogenesis GTPase YlqF [Clostridia bacterium]
MGQSWYPGHMAKALTGLRQSMRLVDVMIEILDARAPRCTANPQFALAAGNKPRLIVLTKADLADPAATKAWMGRFKQEGVRAVLANCQNGSGVSAAIAAAESVAADAHGTGDHSEVALERRIHRRFRSVVVGIPNVGKSSFINQAAGRAGAKTGDRPGVTRGPQWIVVGRDLELLDTPGIMPPRVDDPSTWFVLGCIACISDTQYDVEEVAASLAGRLVESGPVQWRERYGMPPELTDPGLILQHVARVRKCVLPGGGEDTARAADLFIRDFRSGRLGRITLDLP